MSRDAPRAGNRDAILALTGTPGTGKTTVATLLDLPVVALNDLYREAATGRREDGTFEVDLARLAALAAERAGALTTGQAVDTGPELVLEGHLSHRLGLAEMVVVLRCHPRALGERLAARDYSAAKLHENLEAEALGVITAEALEGVTIEVLEEVAAEAPGATVAGALEANTADRRGTITTAPREALPARSPGGKINVHELDTTAVTPRETAARIAAILAGETLHRAPCIDHLDAVLEW